MSFKNIISEKVILPLSDLILGQSVSKHLKFLMKSQWWTKDQLEDFQNKRLRMLVNHAYSTVPYYTDMFNKLGLKPEDIETKHDLKKLPILTKAIIKKEGINRFTSTQYPKKQIRSSSSSGSTGEPLFYLTTKEAYSVNIAANLRGWYWTGYRLGAVFQNFNCDVKAIKKLPRNVMIPTKTIDKII